MERAAREALQPDLLAWPELRAAEARVVDAEAAWREAERRFRYAPHGARKSRLCALQEASAEALRAALDLRELEERLTA